MSGSLYESLAVVVEARAGAAEVVAVEKGTEKGGEAEVEGGRAATWWRDESECLAPPALRAT